MHIRPERIDAARVAELRPGEAMAVYARESDIIIAYWFGKQLIAIVGFIPLGLFCTTAYIWLDTAPAAELFPVGVGRWGIWTIAEIRKTYRRVVGHCVEGGAGIRWMTRLGAKFDPPISGTVRFTIGD